MELQELLTRAPFYNVNKDLPDPDLLMLYDGLQKGEIWLDQEVNWDSCSLIVKYIEYMNRNYPDRTEPIKIKIVSPGGELSVMFVMYHVIMNSKIPVWTYNYGACHSAAFLIFLAGSKRFMHPDGVFVAHEGSAGLGGSYRETKAQMAHYNKEIERMRQIIASRTTFTAEELEKRFETEQDFYITAQEAEKYGVVHEFTLDN